MPAVMPAEHGERNRQIVRHDATSGDGLHGQHGMRPHLAFFYGRDHLRPQDAEREIRISKREDSTDDASSEKDDHCSESEIQVPPEYRWIGLSKKAEDSALLAALRSINDIVCSSGQLAEVLVVRTSAGVLAKGR